MAESKLHIVTSSDLDQLTLVETPSAEALLPIANVLNVDRGKLTRWTGSPTNIVIKASRVSASDPAFFASGFGIARHDFADDVTVRLRLYEGIDQTGTVAYDSSALTVATTIPWGVFIAGVDTWGASFTLGIPSIFSNWFEPTAYKSIQIDIANPTATTVDIGRIYLGYAFVPTANFSYGGVIEWVDLSKHNRTDGGGLRTETVPSYRRFEIPLDWMTDQNRERLSWLLERVTKGGDMLMTLNPNASGREKLENTSVCKRVVNNKFARRYNNINATKLILEEA